MIAQEDYLVIHKLHALGYSISRIARELGLDRKTVRTHLHQSSPPGYHRPPRPSKLDAYRDWIRARLQAAPLTATRLLRERCALGYTGSYSILKRFVATIRPRPPGPARDPLPDSPGEQSLRTPATGYSKTSLPVPGQDNSFHRGHLTRVHRDSSPKTSLV